MSRTFLQQRMHDLPASSARRRPYPTASLRSASRHAAVRASASLWSRVDMGVRDCHSREQASRATAFAPDARDAPAEGLEHNDAQWSRVCAAGKCKLLRARALHLRCVRACECATAHLHMSACLLALTLCKLTAAAKTRGAERQSPPRIPRTPWRWCHPRGARLQCTCLTLAYLLPSASLHRP